MAYIYGRNAVEEALKNKEITKIYVSASKGSIIKTLAKARELKIQISQVDKNRLDEMTDNASHQGIVALVSDYQYKDFDEFLKNTHTDSKVLILDHLEDPHNFGAIARSALFLGYDLIIIPKNRSILVNDTVSKASAGAVYNIEISRVTNISRTIEKLKEHNFWIFGADMNGEDIKEVDFSGNIAIVIGNENKGISKNVLKNVDKVISIKNNSSFDSLNASVAAAIIMYETRR